MSIMRRPTLLRGWKSWYVDFRFLVNIAGAFKIVMVGNEHPAGENRLFDRHGIGTGFLFAAFFVGKLFDFGIRRPEHIIADCRFVRFGSADIQGFRRCGTGLAAAVDKGFCQRAGIDKKAQS